MERNEDKVSIIVPVYNVEKYLNKCIDSLLDQTYTNLEIILVDDGSIDKSSNICDDYLKIDSRIKVIHKTNGGLSDARNVGIKNSTSNYICFIDSDDYVANDYIEKLFFCLKNNDCDIVECEFKRVDSDNPNYKREKEVKIEFFTGKEMVNRIYSKDYVINIIACNKIYKKELFNDIKYPKGKIHEDEGTTYKVLYACKKVAIIREMLYYYRINPNSITNDNFNLKKLDILDIFKERINFFSLKSEWALLDKTISVYLNLLIFLYWNCKKKIKNDTKDIQKKLLSEYKEKYDLVKVSKYLSVKSKFLIIIGRYFPNIYGFFIIK